MPRLKNHVDVLLVFTYTFLVFLKRINLVVTDIGRHIKNGEYVFKDINVLYTNFYSFTEPNFTSINHHWFYGVIVYFLHNLGGFVLLSIFNGLIFALAVVFIYKTAKIYSNRYLACFSVFLAIPFFVNRTEVRPEILSFLFVSIFLYILSLYKNKLVDFKWVLTLIPIQLVWVNTHLFFILGIAICGAFLLDRFILKDFGQFKRIFILLLGLVLVSFINPFFIKGFLVPLNIFKEFGYMLAENQSIFFMQKRFGSLIYIYFEFILGLLLVALAVKYKYLKNALFLIFVFIGFAILAVKFNRAIPLFALGFIPLFSYVLYQFKALSVKNIKLYLPLFIAFFAILALVPTSFSPFYKRMFGVGLLSNQLDSYNFIVTNDIKGPFFNNYDIGSYFIYNFIDSTRPFVDNRPEAYSVDFFKQTYILMQQDEEVWEQKSQDYNINTIYFYRHDFTPWAQPFLLRRVQDPNWVPVYFDNYTIIFVKNTDNNAKLIEQYKIPTEAFAAR
jgi:hypothetical protein